MVHCSVLSSCRTHLTALAARTRGLLKVLHFVQGKRAQDVVQRAPPAERRMRLVLRPVPPSRTPVQERFCPVAVCCSSAKVE